MKNLLLFLPFAFFLSCKEQTKQPETAQTETKEAGWTKPMIYIVEESTTYYDDVTDEDFSDYSNLIAGIYQAIFAGKLQAYHFTEGTPLSIEEVKKMLTTVDTMSVPLPTNPDSLQTMIVATEWEKQTYSAKLKETWHYNTETMQLEKKVIALAPRVPVMSSSGEVKGLTSLFWVFFDKQAEEEFKKKANS